MQVGDKLFYVYSDRRSNRVRKFGYATITAIGRKYITFSGLPRCEKVEKDDMTAGSGGDWGVRLYEAKEFYDYEVGFLRKKGVFSTMFHNDRITKDQYNNIFSILSIV